jgi:broad specificity phosphatase PhoE
VLIYLRHGDDRRDDVYRHDRQLTLHGKEKASKKAKKLIENYGHPVSVYVSPLRRALQTFDVMSTDRFFRKVTMHKDSRLALHLGGKKDPQVSPETLPFVALVEDRPTFEKRVLAQLDDVRQSKGNTWCITHQVVIELIAEHAGVKISGSLDFLDHIVIPR